MEENRPNVMKIRDSIWRIEEKNVCAFLICGPNRSLLLDTGYGTCKIEDIVRSITEKPVFVINTHSDIDHIGGNLHFEKVFMHPAEFSRYMVKSDQDISPLPIWENNIIDLGNYKFKVLLLPGHTPGSIALLEEEKRFLFSGDTVQKGPVYLFGEGRNLDAYISSLEKLMSFIPKFDILYPSHGVPLIEADFVGEMLSGAKKLKNSLLPQIELPMELNYLVGQCFMYKYGETCFLY